MNFLKVFLLSMLKDLLMLFALIYIGEWLADRWQFSRIERAWWISLLTIALLTFVLWYRFGRILLWM